MKFGKKVISFFFDLLLQGYRRSALKSKKQNLAKKAEKNQKLVHVSIDDTFWIFKDLTLHQDRYQSIFDHPVLSYLKTLHDAYGLKVSLYCFYEDDAGFDLCKATDHFAQEFHAQAAWLKIGFHGKNNALTYDKTGKEEAREDYQSVIRELIRICGGEESITSVTRLSSFFGNRESILAMRDCEHGITGLMTADDDRHSYALSQEEESQNGIKIDGIRYYHTDLRMENGRMDLLDDLCKQQMCAIFTHEFYLSSLKIRFNLEKALCRFTKENFQFSFFE